MLYDDEQEAYERLSRDLRGGPDRADVIIVIRRPDGSETRAASFYDASVTMEAAPPVPEWGMPTRLPDPVIHQMRVTTDTGFTVFDPSYFSFRQIEGGL